MKAPAFQLYAGDFLVDTIDWSLEEIGLYTRLLCVEWANGPLPSQPQKLAQIAGITPRKLAIIWPKIARKFVINSDEKYINLRLEETREKQDKYSESRKKGAAAKWSKTDAHAHAHADGMHMHNGCSPSSSPTPTLKQKNIKNIKHIGDAKKNTSPDVKFFIDYANEAFQNKYAQKMLVDGGKDGAIVKKLLKTYGLERLKGLWDVFIQSHDPFICQAGRSIGVFKTQINKLISGGSNGNGNSKQPEAYPAPAYNEDDDPFAEEMAAYKRGELK